MTTKNLKADELKCNFCGKVQDEVKRLISGPHVYICDECISLCSEILLEETTEEKTLIMKDIPKPMEIKEKFSDKISLFSGIDFNVDKEKGLTGFCDFIFSNSPEQLYLDSPVITITEAKNENIVSGLGQCIAEMYASQIYNEKEGYDLSSVYGGVTTGDEWKFIKLTKDTAHIDADNYYINDIEKIVGILTEMVQQNA